MRHAMRWLSVVGALCGSWSAVAMAEGSPVDRGGVDGEGIREMRALYEAEQSSLWEKDKYSQDLAQVGFAPVACADGSRAPVPGPGWVAGCHFAYHVESVTGWPAEPSFAAIARGAVGTPAEDVTLGIGSLPNQGIFFWLERSGVRRFVYWDEPAPGESVCAAQERVGVEEIRALFTAERAYLQEKDRYSSDFAQVGFAPLGCTDGTRPSGPDSSWVGGCRFIYQVEVTGPFSFIATARAVSGVISGMTLRMDETGTLTRAPAPSGACP
ncbi:hypothetical protein D187_005029 [Cystobacter fuscus DSM 2262]|uniref:Lipoprotein n=1 Tax=Cystobacter fuscus (strain ATCC 25194 / DSM 2262 / NBRC 100088 / M29) TaxID=1242864 RepID=S9QRH4_CYSF2|nr:hypothetical protein [Cystobacter fuscus]EPX63899.1 hypothetical protein D187_005029 [Cystobacter fuscus DSM 2262]